MPKQERPFKLYSFLVTIDEPRVQGSYIHVIARDMRECRRVVHDLYGKDFDKYLPGGELYSVSDASYSVINKGFVVE